MMFTVKYVNEPREATGKYGNIKSPEGVTIMVPKDMLHLFQAGTTVDIPTKPQTWGQGTESERQVIIATAGPGGYSPPSRGQGGPIGVQRNTGFQPRVVQNPPALAPRTTDQEKMIFVTGVVGRSMGSGKFAASEIPVLTQAALIAWDQHLGPQAKPQNLRSVPMESPPEPEADDPGPQLQ
jgi:hypothetical protein